MNPPLPRKGGSIGAHRLDAKNACAPITFLGLSLPEYRYHAMKITIGVEPQAV